MTRFCKKLDYRNRKIYYRNSSINLLLICGRFFIHKGMYLKPADTSLFDLTTKFGTFTITRKPLAHPIKKVKKKKRIGKIKPNRTKHYYDRQTSLYDELFKLW